MLEAIGKMALVGAAWFTLIWCCASALRPWLREQDRRAMNNLDGFTPSMARWGYVGEKRGQK
jgi:hypothetical protein